MSFLKKLGDAIIKGANAAKSLLPAAAKVTEAISPFVPQLGTVSADLEKIAGVVANVEVFGQVLNQDGANKLQAATPVVAQVILQSSLLAGHKIANPELFNQGAKQIAAGMADVLNSLSADAVKV